jgi:hypothetical protein
LHLELNTFFATPVSLDKRLFIFNKSADLPSLHMFSSTSHQRPPASRNYVDSDIEVSRADDVAVAVSIPPPPPPGTSGGIDPQMAEFTAKRRGILYNIFNFIKETGLVIFNEHEYLQYIDSDNEDGDADDGGYTFDSDTEASVSAVNENITVFEIKPDVFAQIRLKKENSVDGDTDDEGEDYISDVAEALHQKRVPDEENSHAPKAEKFVDADPSGVIYVPSASAQASFSRRVADYVYTHASTDTVPRRVPETNCISTSDKAMRELSREPMASEMYWSHAMCAHTLAGVVDSLQSAGELLAASDEAAGKNGELKDRAGRSNPAPRFRENQQAIVKIAQSINVLLDLIQGQKISH